uniref:Uncharacterized protein n=1 Tax=Arundo donax TaxID=35708 RepID=A0A0A9A3S4_ARUDO
MENFQLGAPRASVNPRIAPNASRKIRSNLSRNCTYM